MQNETTLKYGLSKDRMGLKKYIRRLGGGKVWYHVHSDEMTELERWIHKLLSSPNDCREGGA